MTIYQSNNHTISIAELKLNKDAVAQMVADLRSHGLSWADIVGLAALAAHNSGEAEIAEVLGAAARQCGQVEETE